MTFKEWGDSHNAKIETILVKLKGKSDIEVVRYFDYDNMAKEESDFCPLYDMGTKCHETDKPFSCYLCGCPFFKESDNEPFYIKSDGTKVMSICSIDAKNAGTFIQDGVQQCDCTGCLIPHNPKLTLRFLKDKRCK